MSVSSRFVGASVATTLGLEVSLMVSLRPTGLGLTGIGLRLPKT